MTDRTAIRHLVHVLRDITRRAEAGDWTTEEEDRCYATIHAAEYLEEYLETWE